MTSRTSKPKGTSRAGGQHVKTGCVTCKIRHVKCGEEKPACLRCRSTGRTCDGYDHKKCAPKTQFAVALRSQASFNKPILPNPTNSLPGTAREKSSFEYYVLELGQDVSHSMKLSSLHQLIYQICHADAAVRQAVIALGALGQRLRINPVLTGDNQQANDCHDYALSQYSKALGYLHRQILNDADRWQPRILISCFLFTIFEFLQGNEEGALAHLRSGLRILHGSEPGHTTEPTASWIDRFEEAVKIDSKGSVNIKLPIEELREICACGTPLCGHGRWQDPVTGEFLDATSGSWLPTLRPLAPARDPTTCELLRAFIVMENTALLWLGLDTWEAPLLAPLGVRDRGPKHSNHFPSITDAADAIIYQILQTRDISRSFVSVGFLKYGSLVPLFDAKKQEMLNQLACWLQGLDDLQKRLGSLCNGETLHKMQVMRANHEMVYILLSLLAFESAETNKISRMEPHFKRIISLAQSILHSCEDRSSSNPPHFVVSRPRIGDCTPDGMFMFHCCGLIQPLFITAVKCPDQSLRNEAISLLKTRPWRESAWESATMAKIALKRRGSVVDHSIVDMGDWQNNFMSATSYLDSDI